MILATRFTFIVEKSCTLTHSLTFILNLSPLTKGMIDEWKFARVTLPSHFHIIYCKQSI